MIEGEPETTLHVNSKITILQVFENCTFLCIICAPGVSEHGDELVNSQLIHSVRYINVLI